MATVNWLEFIRDRLASSLDHVERLTEIANANARRELAEVADLVLEASRQLCVLFPDDLNLAIGSVLWKRPSRTATCTSLATAIGVQHLWRSPVDGGPPNVWQLRRWVRSEQSLGLFTLKRDRVGLQDRCGLPLGLAGDRLPGHPAAVRLTRDRNGLVRPARSPHAEVS
jgi:hypothetical protein